MPRDEEDRVFDVSKPHKVTPDATSKPVIVGHHPMMNDPMVREDSTAALSHGSQRTIAVHAPEDGEKTIPVSPPVAESPTAPHQPEPKSQPLPPAPEAIPAVPPTLPEDLHLTSLEDVIGHEHKLPGHEHPSHPAHDAHVGPNPAQAAQKKSTRSGGKMLWVLIALLLVVVAGYLLIDSRVIKTSINLPFHIFKQPAPITQPQSAPVATQKQTNSTTSTTDAYAGWKSYTLANEKAAFKYPSTWTLTVNSSAPTDQEDSVGLSAPSGFYLNISDISTGHPSLECPTSVVYSKPITFIGQTGYVNYYSEGAPCQTGDQITGAELSKTSVGVFSDLFSTKNINPAGYFTISLGNKTDPALTESAVKASSDYTDAGLVLESMSY